MWDMKMLEENIERTIQTIGKTQKYRQQKQK